MTTCNIMELDKEPLAPIKTGKKEAKNNSVVPHPPFRISMPNEIHRDDQPKEENLVAKMTAIVTNTKEDIKNRRKTEEEMQAENNFVENKNIKEQEKCIKTQRENITKQKQNIEERKNGIDDIENYIEQQNKIIDKHEKENRNLAENVKKMKRCIAEKKKIIDEKMTGYELGHQKTQDTKLKRENVADQEAQENLNEKKSSNDEKQRITSNEETKSNIENNENAKEAGKIDVSKSSTKAEKQMNASNKGDISKEIETFFEKVNAFTGDTERSSKNFKKIINGLIDLINQKKQSIKHLRENIALQEENIDVQTKNIENQKRLLEGIGGHCVVCKKVDNKRNDVLKVLAGAMMIFASFLVTWADLTENSSFCERAEALNSINVSYPMACKNEKIREKMRSIKEMGISSLCIDFLFLFIGSMLVSPKSRRYGWVFLHFCLAVTAVAFFYPLFNTYTEIKDLKSSQEDPDYAEIKNIMLKALGQTYSSDDIVDTHTASGKWNAFFIKYDCCAVNQVTGTTNDFDTTPWCTTSGSCQQTNSQIPKACCKGVTKDDFQNAPSSCHASVTDGTYKDSCLIQLISLGDVSIEECQILVLCSCLFVLGTMKIAACLIAAEMIVISIISFLRQKSCFKTDS